MVALALPSAACADVVEDITDTVEGPKNGPGGVSLDGRGPLGDLGPALLSGSVSRAVVEIDTTGRDLSASALSALDAALREHGRKDLVRFAGSAEVSRQDVYTTQDLRRLSDRHRSASSARRRVVIHVLVLEGRFEDEDALGVAFEAGGFAVFPDRIGAGIFSSLRYDRFEEAVVVHELGHLFGLVNVTGEGSFHEDPEHPGHSASRDSVMFWAVEDVSVATIFRGGPPTGFDADDRREMTRIRG